MKAFMSQEGKSAVLGYYDMLLNQMDVPHEKLNIHTRYGNTWVLAAGNASLPPVVLLHGSSMNSAMWIQDMQTMSRCFRVFAPDMPGEPGHSEETQLSFETDDYVKWLDDTFSGLKIERAAIVGASLGAWLALGFSIHNTEKVTKLAMLSPAGIGSQNHAFKEVALSLLPKGEEGLNELFCRINGDQSIPKIMLDYQKLIAVCFNSRKEALPVYTDDELKRLTMPCMLFVGDKDIMLLSAETVERFSRLLPQGKAVRFPNRGHSLTGLAEEIMAFLKDS